LGERHDRAADLLIPIALQAGPAARDQPSARPVELGDARDLRTAPAIIA